MDHQIFCEKIYYVCQFNINITDINYKALLKYFFEIELNLSWVVLIFGGKSYRADGIIDFPCVEKTVEAMIS